MSAPREHELDDGTFVTAQEIADAVKIHIVSARKRLRGSRKREVLFAPTRSQRGERTYTRDGVSLTATDVCARVPGLKHVSAGVRGLAWERGELSTEQLFLPKKEYRGIKNGAALASRGNAEWQALSSKKRDHMLHRIPTVTPWERKQLRGT